MDILNEINSKQDFKSTEIEVVQKEKIELNLLGTFIITNGLKLWEYNHREDKIIEVAINSKEAIEIEFIDNSSVSKTIAEKECTVDSRNTYFEALNHNTA